ncbi:MAG: helix-turn-helix transcriptional regulator [Xanthomonadales bacterium]|nr:helix-turn-helix transcriptional regulator [Xanthomonadales bacterium]
MRRVLATRDWTQKKAAEVAGVQHTAINGLISGRLKSVYVETGLKICKALGISPFYLFLGEGEEKLGDVPSYNQDLMAQVIVAVETAIQDSGVEIAPARKAALINGFYLNASLGRDIPSSAEIRNLLQAVA